MDKKTNNYAFVSVVALVVGVMAAPVSAVTQVGKVIQSVGDFKALQPDQSERKLKRRSKIIENDTLVTGANARAQVRFIDNAMMEFQPGSEFKVESYQYQGKKGGESFAVTTLIKGGMRTITGAIGKGEPKSYKVNTPVGSIGIRGTHYGVRICSDDCGPEIPNGLYAGVVDGRIVFSNEAGDFEYTRDRYFYVAGAGATPRPMLAPPGVIFDAPQQEQGEATELGGGDEGGDGGFSGSTVATSGGSSTETSPVDLAEAVNSDTGLDSTGEPVIAAEQETQTAVPAPAGSVIGLAGVVDPTGSYVEGNATMGLVDGVNITATLDTGNVPVDIHVDNPTECSPSPECVYNWVGVPVVETGSVTLADTGGAYEVNFGRWGNGGTATEMGLTIPIFR